MEFNEINDNNLEQVSGGAKKSPDHRKKRPAKKLPRQEVVSCPRCNELKILYKPCTNCGYYDGVTR